MEIQLLQDATPTVDARAGLVRYRRRLVAIRRRLSSQQGLFVEVAGRRIGPGRDGPWLLLDRLETASGSAQSAADDAAAASWAPGRDAGRRKRQLMLVLIGSWVTLVAVAVSVRVSGALGTGEVEPILFVAAVLGVVTILLIAAVWSRRWN